MKKQDSHDTNQPLKNGADNPVPGSAPELSDRFEAWAIVEIFGHQKLAGRISEFALGGCNFVRVDVPELPARKKVGYREAVALQPAFTKLYGQGAIYSITLVAESVARAAAEAIRPEPISVYIPTSGQAEIEAGDDGRYS